MRLKFYKYQGAGNDFVIIDNRSNAVHKLEQKTVAEICHRRFGIGADGLILLQNKDGFDFEMIYFNADGKIGSMCGNGGRCIAAFAKRLGIIENECIFWAADGEHFAKIIDSGYVELKMGEVKDIEISAESCFLNTGSPHYISFVDRVDEINVYKAGQEIRFSDEYKENGVNVNFVEICAQNRLKVYTYERGVEDETLACGTGVTAASLAYFLQKTEKQKGYHKIDIITKGANLSVKFVYENSEFEDIWLCGAATYVFEGEIHLNIQS